MNRRIKTKVMHLIQKKGFLTKSILKPYGRETDMPPAWELNNSSSSMPINFRYYYTDKKTRKVSKDFEAFTLGSSSTLEVLEKLKKFFEFNWSLFIKVLVAIKRRACHGSVRTIAPKRAHNS